MKKDWKKKKKNFYENIFALLKSIDTNVVVPSWCSRINENGHILINRNIRISKSSCGWIIIQSHVYITFFFFFLLIFESIFFSFFDLQSTAVSKLVSFILISSAWLSSAKLFVKNSKNS